MTAQVITGTLCAVSRLVAFRAGWDGPGNRSALAGRRPAASRRSRMPRRDPAVGSSTETRSPKVGVHRCGARLGRGPSHLVREGGVSTPAIAPAAVSLDCMARSPSPLKTQELWRLLHDLDHPTNLERPAGYDQAVTRARFDRLAQRLDSDFSALCSVDRDVQDASHHGRIEIPEQATASQVRLVLVVSNFGNMVVLAAENPGSHTDVEAGAIIAVEDRNRIGDALADLGYVLVPEEPLWQVYDGASVALRAAYSDPKHITWWIRFFDFL